MGKDLVFLKDVEYFADRCTYERVSTVCSSMIAWKESGYCDRRQRIEYRKSDIKRSEADTDDKKRMTIRWY